MPLVLDFAHVFSPETADTFGTHAIVILLPCEVSVHTQGVQCRCGPRNAGRLHGEVVAVCFQYCSPVTDEKLGCAE
jgi:hypothetical protein